jgi:hypothetical protein
MQTLIKKKRPLPPGIKQFILAAAVVTTLCGWRSFAEELPQKEVTPPQVVAPMAQPEVAPSPTVAPNVKRRVLSKTSYQSAPRPRPTPVAVTRSSR